MKTLQITLSAAQNQYIEEQMRAGDYDNPSEYFHDLIRRDQKRNARQALEEGLLVTLAEETADDPREHHTHHHPPQKP